MKKIKRFLPVGIILFVLIIFTLSTIFIVNTSKKTQTNSSNIIQQQNVSFKKAEGLILKDIPQIPAYPGVKINYSYTKTVGNKSGYEIEWESEETVTNITNWYLTALPANGWTITKIPESLATITPPGPTKDIELTILAQKENREVSLIIEQEHGADKSEIYAEFSIK